MDTLAPGNIETSSQMKLNPFSFEQSGEGSGVFGRWILDENGLPAYDYQMNHRRDPRAYYINSQGRDRRDHWHQVGNDRITALAANDGIVQFYSADRGGVFINRFEAFNEDRPRGITGNVNALFRRIITLIGIVRAWQIRCQSQMAKTPRGTTSLEGTLEPRQKQKKQKREDKATERLAFTGGFGYLGKQETEKEDKTWATAFRYAPAEAKTRRVFGIGYFETEIDYNNIHLKRRVYAPYRDDPASPPPHEDIKSRSAVYAPDGNDPILLIDVEIENQGSKTENLRYYEYWDINVYQMQVQWIRTGLPAILGDIQRSSINERFSTTIEPWQPESQVLRFKQERCGGTVYGGLRSEVDTRLSDIFLANISGQPAEPYVDMSRFFGTGGVQTPDAVRFRMESMAVAEDTTISMPYCLVLRHDLILEPGEVATLRYAYGIAKPGQSLEFLDKYRIGDGFKQTTAVWKRQLAYFTTGQDFTLQREIAWHSYKLLSATLYSEYYRAHYSPQGSAYQYLHGADGAPRDQALFVLPMIYLRPALAKDILRLLMRLQHSDTLEFPYSFVGHGLHSDAMGIHAEPSDLDLFFLWALAEYLAATGDMDFLNDDVDFYPSGVRPFAVPGITTLDHVRAAFKHLAEGIGVGPHGLLRLGDGDWDDSIVIETSIRNPQINRLKTICRGESIPNSQMAIYVLPLIASVIERYDSDLAAQMRTFNTNLHQALSRKEDPTAWNADQNWYNRAFLRNNRDEVVVLNDNHISLQSQPWALISGLAQEMGVEDALIEKVKQLLDDPSPTGAMLAEKGQVWPAVSQLLTWGYRRNHPKLAWRQLNRHTFAIHAIVFPNVWFNIWSGPDGTNSQDSPNPGGTWSSPVTPMTDFPVMNSNQHAMALFGILRVCGIEPTSDGLLIAPKPPPERFIIDLPLLRLEYEPGRIAGVYRAIVTGSITLHICIPAETKQVLANVAGIPQVSTSTDPANIVLSLILTAGEAVPFEVTWES
ncbi:MAG: hypothetical protein H0X30_02835 [Anaerolineae bacterium]|nr:hypothetical protein [Anaerolineae bacterium]